MRLMHMTVRRVGELAALALFAAACTGSGAATTTSTTGDGATSLAAGTSLATVPTTVPATPSSTTADGQTGGDRDDRWPLAEAPNAYALVSSDTVEIVRGGQGPEVLDITGFRSGVILDGDLIFGVETSSGTWVWPTRGDEEITLPGARQPVSLMIAPPEGEVSAWFHDAGVVDDRATVLYREIESETDPIESRMMLFDIETGLPETIFDKDERRSDMSDEEAEALIVDAALFPDRIAVLFNVGDSNWVEWFDFDGELLDPPPFLEEIEGMVLEIESAGERVALGVEPELHRLITEVWIGSLEAEAPGRSLTHEVAGESLADVAFDGRFVTAGLRDGEGEDIGYFVADLQSNDTATGEGTSSVVLTAR